MKTTFSRKILAGFIACVFILAAVAFFSFRNGEKFLAAGRSVTGTHEVVNGFAGLINVEAQHPAYRLLLFRPMPYIMPCPSGKSLNC